MATLLLSNPDATNSADESKPPVNLSARGAKRVAPPFSSFFLHGGREILPVRVLPLQRPCSRRLRPMRRTVSRETVD
jgi:hypothetical protein